MLALTGPEGRRQGAEGGRTGDGALCAWPMGSELRCPSKFIKVSFISEDNLGSFTATGSFLVLSPCILSFAMLLFSLRLLYYF